MANCVILLSYAEIWGTVAFVDKHFSGVFWLWLQMYISATKPKAQLVKWGRLMQGWSASRVWLDNTVPAKKARALEDVRTGSKRSEFCWSSKDCPAAAIRMTAIKGELKSNAFLSVVDQSQLPDSHLGLNCIIHILLRSIYALLGSVWSELWVTHPITCGKWQQMFHFWGFFFLLHAFSKTPEVT